MIQDQIKLAGWPVRKAPPGPILNLRFQAAASQRPHDAAIGKKQRFGPLLLRTGPFDAGRK
jgi:hypothetical protein